MQIQINTRIVSFIKIVDIRLEEEWEESGIIKDSITLSFFDEFGNYDTDEFIKKLEKQIDTSTRFALVCKTGARTAFIVRELRERGLDAISLDGGIRDLLRQGYTLEEYKKS